MGRFDATAMYIRRSTEEQSDEHQLDDISAWLDRHDLAIGEVDEYSEHGSGASEERDEFRQLIEAIESDTYTDVVVWEISRIARKGLLAQRFFDACEEHNTVIHVTNGSVREIRPDGTGRMVAGIIAEVAAEERRTLIRRTKSGVTRARKEGKWVGQVPVGFTTVDGYLKPNLDPDYDEDESGFLDVVDALERLEDGESYRSVGSDTPNVTRQTLMRIDRDGDRKAWYLDNEADDERVDEALNMVGDAESA
jgi:DNA invertase Pin-like site-specific DNA recombinase